MLAVYFLIFFLATNPANSQITTSTNHRDNNRRRHNLNIDALGNLTTERPSYRQIPDRSPNNEIEYRLTRLEVSIGEKLESLRSEIRDTNRRLQALEWQSAESQTVLENLRSDVTRLSQQIFGGGGVVNNVNNGGEGPLGPKLDYLTKGMQILIAASRVTNYDVHSLKKNVSALMNDTRSILRLAPQLVTKQFLNNGLLELKHHQMYPQWAPNSCTSAPQGRTNNPLPKNCKEIQESGQPMSGIYRIQPEHADKPFMAVCDLQTRGGGWTVIQNRFDGTQDFYQNWHDYKYGFGNLGGEFWLGLDHIHQLTGYDVSELLIELQDMDMQNKSAHYAAFSVAPEVEGFALKVLGGYSGDAGDSLVYHAGNRFSAKDMDQDGWPEGSCAQAHGGAWWYKSCDMSNLNGRYLSGELPEQYIYQGMYWGEFRGAQYSLLRARMLVRPREQISPLLLDEIFTGSPPKSERDILPVL